MRTAYLIAGTDATTPVLPVKSRDVGPVKAASLAHLLNPSIDYTQTGYQVTVLAGAPTYQLEATLDEIQPCDPLRVYDEAAAHWTAIPGLAGLTADTIGDVGVPIRALRVRVTAGVGSVLVAIAQSGQGG